LTCSGEPTSQWPANPAFRAGFAKVPITPTGFEGFVDFANNGDFDPNPHMSNGMSYPADVFLDTGIDGKFDFQEDGAFGPDGKPGIAGRDDDGDGCADDVLGCSPADDPQSPCAHACEYLAKGSDDVADPAHDNYDATSNPTGTEKDGKWQNVVIAGYGGILTGDPIRPAQGIHDDIWVRAMVLAQGSDVMAIVSVDTVGYLHIYGNAAKRRIAQKTGIPLENIIYMANHDHDAPDVIGIWASPDKMDFAYLEKVQDAMVQAVTDAVAALRPAKLKSATTEIDGCYDQTTLRFKKGSQCHFPAGLKDLDAAPQNYDKPVNQIDLRDPMVFNHNVTALQLSDAQTGATLGTVVNFHDHPEVLGSQNNQISSDFPNYARAALERDLGGIAIYVSGTTGSQIGTLHDTNVPLRDEQGHVVPDPTGRVDADGKPFPAFAENDASDPRHPPYDKIRSIGFLVAEAAEAALSSAPESPNPKISLQASDLDIPVNNPELGLVLRLIQAAAKAHGYDDPKDLPIDAAYCPADSGQRTCVRISIAVATVGDVTFLTAPGEPAPEYLLGRPASQVDYGPPWGVYSFAAMPRLRDHVKTRDVIMLDISNGYLGYMVPEGDYLDDDTHPNYYEERPSAGRLYGDTVGNKLLRMLGAPASVTFNEHAVPHP
jgi:hypothetical protein